MGCSATRGITLIKSRFVRDALMASLVFSSFALVGGSDRAEASCRKCSPRATCYPVSVGYKSCSFRCGLFTCSCRQMIECPLRYSPPPADGTNDTPSLPEVASNQSAIPFVPDGAAARPLPSVCLASQAPIRPPDCRVENGMLLTPSCEGTIRAEAQPKQQPTILAVQGIVAPVP